MLMANNNNKNVNRITSQSNIYRFTSISGYIRIHHFLFISCIQLHFSSILCYSLMHTKIIIRKIVEHLVLKVYIFFVIFVGKYFKYVY